MEPDFYVLRPASKEPPRDQLDVFGSLYREMSANVGQPDLFAEQAASEHAAEIELLIPIAQRLAAQSGEAGTTIADVREEAVKLGILPPLGEGRSLSYLGALMRRAGLRATNKTRRSHVEGSHQNRHVCWTLPAYANQETAA